MPSDAPVLRIGTRGSPLARIQAEMVRRAYLDRFPDREAELVIVNTAGDRDPERSLTAFGAQGVFVKEIEEQVRQGKIDAAVHSAKDLASEDPEDLELVAFLERGAAYDVLIRGDAASSHREAGPGYRIATDSPRRRAQLGEIWPGVDFVDIRGNIQTRLDRLDAGGADALVLAAAGLRRLELNPAGEEALPVARCVPAPGQGAIAVQAREDGPLTADLRWLNHHATALAVQTERDMASALGASCTVPLGVYVEFRGGTTRLMAALHDGERMHRVETRSAAGDPGESVELAMAELRERGAKWTGRQ
jgi:hydroxymethylbilane synthase